jgi:hypothetical protein
MPMNHSILETKLRQTPAAILLSKPVPYLGSDSLATRAGEAVNLQEIVCAVTPLVKADKDRSDVQQNSVKILSKILFAKNSHFN